MFIATTLGMPVSTAHRRGGSLVDRHASIQSGAGAVMATQFVYPDYQGGSLLNLMASIVAAGGGATDYTLLPQLDHARLRAARNVVLLLLDGLGHELLQRVGARSALAQHQRTTLTSVFPSATTPAITTLLTGLAPQQHALTGWFTYLRELGTVTTVLPFFTRLGRFPLSSANLVPANLFGLTSVFDTIKRPGCVISPHNIIDSAFNSSMSGRAKRIGYQRCEDMFSALARQITGAPEAQYIYCYYPGIDSLCHEFGTGSQEVAADFQLVDAGFERLLKAIAGTDTLLLVTADHGLIDAGKSHTLMLESMPRLHRMLRLPLCGEPRAVFCYVKPDCVSEFEQFCAQELADYAQLLSCDAAIERGLFGPGAPNANLRDRIGDYVLLMRENYALRDSIAADGRYVQIGVHGGLSREEMLIPLIVVDGLALN